MSSPGWPGAAAERRRRPPRTGAAAYNPSATDPRRRTPELTAPHRLPLRPIPSPSIRPWAGARLGGPRGGVGELWLAGPGSLVDYEGRTLTLDALAAAQGESLVGTRAMRRLGPRFPLLVKLIDAADWLSLQVHPDDALARELHGPHALGKAEAWLVLAADPEATMISGPGRDLDAAALRGAIASGTLGRAGCEERHAIPGDTFLLAPGTLHAVGAGVFLYEIEQPSDLTYRVSDWGRPASPDRPLHVAESLRAVVPGAHAAPAGRAWTLDDGALRIPAFALELLRGGPTEREPAGGSVEVVTVVAGSAKLDGDGWALDLEEWETAVIPAAADAYRITGAPDAVTCVGSIP